MAQFAFPPHAANVIVAHLSLGVTCGVGHPLEQDLTPGQPTGQQISPGLLQNESESHAAMNAAAHTDGAMSTTFEHCSPVLLAELTLMHAAPITRSRLYEYILICNVSLCCIFV